MVTGKAPGGAPSEGWGAMQHFQAGQRGRRVVLCPAGTQVGGYSVEAMRGPAHRTDEPLVRLATLVGAVTSVRQQRFRVRRRGLRPGDSFGEPVWVAACSVQLGDYLYRPARLGMAEWFPVGEVTHLLPDELLYAVETDEETLTVNGFLAEAQPVP